MVQDYYSKIQRQYPDLEPHDCLAQIWLARMSSYGIDLSSRESQIVAYATTELFACLSPNNRIKALSFYIYFKENEENGVFLSNPQLVKELMDSRAGKDFEEIMEQLEDSDSNILYAKYNPKSAQKRDKN